MLAFEDPHSRSNRCENPGGGPSTRKNEGWTPKATHVIERLASRFQATGAKGRKHLCIQSRRVPHHHHLVDASISGTHSFHQRDDVVRFYWWTGKETNLVCFSLASMLSLGLRQSSSRGARAVVSRSFSLVPTRRFSNSSGWPGASSQPGFLTAERVEELKRLPKPIPEPLRTVFPLLSQRRHASDERIPDLAKVQTLHEASKPSFLLSLLLLSP